MNQNLCTRTERRLRRLGYERNAAHRFAGFFYVSMMSVCSLMVMGMRRRRHQTGIVEEIPRSIRRVLSVIVQHLYLIAGAGTSIADARAVPVLSADRIHRR